MIYFLHIHKAAGSTFVNMAHNNGEILFPNNKNGNPYDENNNIIKFWNYSYDELYEFTNKKTYTLISNETRLLFFHKIPHLKYVTIIRNPIDIIISNYHHIKKNKDITLEEYLNIKSNYVRGPISFYFGGKEKALSNALNFDYIIRMDKFSDDIRCMKEMNWKFLDVNKYRVGTKRNTNAIEELDSCDYDYIHNMLIDDIELYNELYNRIEFGKIK